MAAVRAQGLPLFSSSSLQAPCGRRVRAGLHTPLKVAVPSLSLVKVPRKVMIMEELIVREGKVPRKVMTMEELIVREGTASTSRDQDQPSTSRVYDDDDLVAAKLYEIMEAAADRAGMHDAIGAQRDNWNTLLLGSLNSINLAASVAAGLAAIPAGVDSPHHLAFKVSSVLLYSAATAMSLVVNKIQPSQLVEEQRNAARLFRQLEKKIKTTIALGRPTLADVDDALERVLALDKAYPLSLLPGMLEKFPKTVEPTVWWPKLRHRRGQQPRQRQTGRREGNNGWSEGLEHVMTGVLRVLKKNDTVEYVKLGKLVLGINTVLATAGPLLTGLAAIGASSIDGGSPGGWPLLLGVVGGSLATVVNTLEHGGQVGMVFELYRNCAGFYRQLEEEIEFNLEEGEVQSREEGELFELKMALQLGRSLPELRGLSSYSCTRDEDIREYAGKLF